MATAVEPVRRTSIRQALRRPPSRSKLRDANGSTIVSGPQQARRQKYEEDSSEEEIPVPKPSALTKAFLRDSAPEVYNKPPSQPTRRQGSRTSSSQVGDVRDRRQSQLAVRHDVDDRQSLRPPDGKVSPVRKRIVRLSSTPQSLNQIQHHKRRSASVARTNGSQRSGSARPSSSGSAQERGVHDRAVTPHDGQPASNTPAHAERVVRIAPGSSGHRSRLGSAALSSGPSNYDRSLIETDANELDEPKTASRQAGNANHSSISRHASKRIKPEDNVNLQGSVRVKRVVKIPGSFLSGPARRGRRRRSEEDADEGVEPEAVPSARGSGSGNADDRPEARNYSDDRHPIDSGSPIGSGSIARAAQRKHLTQVDAQNIQARTSPKGMLILTKSVGHIPEDILPRPVIIPNDHDQENDLLNSYRTAKKQAAHLIEKLSRRPLDAELGAGKPLSPQRKPLTPLVNNAPYRPALPPPPPKMSVLQAATSNAGAAATTSQAKQRRNVFKVNGKCYTRLDCLGRGGSARVYRVSAENGNMFALKRVSLENADETIIKGFKGEIDLLQCLRNVDRVIKLFDREMNAEKQVLTLLMEMGDQDLYKLLSSREKSETAKFDVDFVRHYWKEMLKCVQSVHQYDIVHSDLKPANFVLVGGRLKLIDFGIANAIQTDETVNVHRDTQIGTPNYMSPESLMDSNNPRGSRSNNRPKLMKLGKPSDVWSLGCILYQMVYGLPPFGHIPNQIERCQAIINWDYQIEYSTRAMGGGSVPPAFLRTMRRCLQRDQNLRPSCKELLREADECSLGTSQLYQKPLCLDSEQLNRIVRDVVARCRVRIPTDAESAAWSQEYQSGIRKLMASKA